MVLLYFVFVFIFGLIIGSFLNCLIWRLHNGESVGGRSYCPKCRHMIAWYDNIPIFSFILLGGKCRHCAEPISFQYPLVEATVGGLFVLAFWKNMIEGDLINLSTNYQVFIFLIRDFFLIAIMVIVFIYDLRWYLVLDKVTIPAIIIIFLFNLFLGFDWQNLVISGIIGSGIFLFQFLISKGKWIGGGDIRLGLLIGVSLGWPYVLLALLLAYLLGSIIGISLILFRKKSWQSELPFGVFLSTATIIILFAGDWFFKFFNF